MKISNRSLSLILVVCLLLLAMPPGGAGAYVNEDKAQRLHELGLYSGIDPQVFTPDLGGSIDRQTGLAMIVKLFGHEAEALALSEIEISQALAPFPDAGDVAPWARPYVAWAIINNIATGLPMSQTVTVTVRDSAFVSGPGYPVNVAPGTHSATIQVFPADALVTAESSDSSILKVLSISPDGEQRTLSFQGLKAGECKIRLNASKTGFAPATAEITVNVTKQIVIGGLKDSYDLGSGAQEIPFKLNPSSASLSVECDDSSLVTSLAVTGSGAERRLVFSTHGTGSCLITLTASCEGYNGASRSIAINTTADWISDSSPPAVAINGLNDVTVPVETVKYIPFTTSPADAALSVSVVNPGGTEVLKVPCPSPITMGNTRFLVVLPNAQGTAQVTVMASSPGWSGSSQTINVTAADPSGAKLGPEFAEGKPVTGSSFSVISKSFTVSPATVQVSTYYENIDPNVIQSATVSGSTLSVNRELLIDSGNAGDAQVIIVGRLNEFLDSLLLNIEVL